MEKIVSKTNARVKRWAKLKEKKYRDQLGCFLVEGEHLVLEAMQANCIECILIEEGHEFDTKDYPCYEVTSDIMKKLSSSVSGTWMIAICHMLQQSQELGKRLILLDGVQDPGNVGTIIRSAYSFGFDTVVVSKECCDVYSDKVIRSTQGALFHIQVLREDLQTVVKTLQQKQIPVYATALENALPMKEVKKVHELALVFGNEGKGVSKDLLAMSDQNVYIEMHAFESLNVAVAAGICMYNFS